MCACWLPVPSTHPTQISLRMFRAGKYQFIYITPEMASVSIDRLRALQQAAVRCREC